MMPQADVQTRQKDLVSLIVIFPPYNRAHCLQDRLRNILRKIFLLAVRGE
jgi:hypothetical protein